jgi:endonuclease YncB( thermonuclease family)
VSDWAWPNTVVTRVIDGDTCDAQVTRDLGFNGQATFPVRLRLHRIDCYKDTTKRGKAAKELVERLLLPAPVHAVTVGPYKYGGPKTRTGEWMAELVLPDGTNLSDLLVAEKLAIYWNGQGLRPAVDIDHP